MPNYILGDTCLLVTELLGIKAQILVKKTLSNIYDGALLAKTVHGF